MENLCYVWWCQSCAVRTLAGRAPPNAGFPAAGNCVGACLLAWLLKPFAFVDLCVFYLPMRKGFAPPGYRWNGCQECCRLWYCFQCTLCQELNASDRRMEEGKPAWTTQTQAPGQKRMR